VSAYVEKHFITVLEANKNYQNKDYEKALRETFMNMDEILKTPEGKKQIITIQK
jgi:protein phosphatase/protein phosphatase 1G